MIKPFTVSVADVYGKDYQSIPNGYIGEFRPIERGDRYISPFSGKIVPVFSSPGGLILRIVLTPVKRKVITFTETGEVRVPKLGEHFMCDDGTDMYCASINFYVSNYSIYTRTESEI